MYCGICIEVCPFDALHWSPQFEYAEVDILDLLHEKERLGGWMATVPPPPALDEKSAEPARGRRGQQARPRHRPRRRRAPPGGPGARMPRTVRPRPAGARGATPPAPEPEPPADGDAS